MKKINLERDGNIPWDAIIVIVRDCCRMMILARFRVAYFVDDNTVLIKWLTIIK